MAGLETQQQTSNEVSHAEWSAQDRLRQELRALEEQQRAEQATEGTEQKTRQVVEERVRHATVASTELKGESGLRNRKRRKGGVFQQIPYSFDVLCLCAVTIGAAFVIGPLTHPPTPILPPSSQHIPPNFNPGFITPGDNFTMSQFPDVAGNNWAGSSVRIVETMPGEGGLNNIRARWNFLKGGQPYGAEDCTGTWNPRTGEVHLQGYNIEQFSYDGASHLVPGDYTFQVGANGTIQNGVMQGLNNGIGAPGTFSGSLR